MIASTEAGFRSAASMLEPLLPSRSVYCRDCCPLAPLSHMSRSMGVCRAGGQGEAYYRKMMANKAKRAGHFVADFEDGPAPSPSNPIGSSGPSSPSSSGGAGTLKPESTEASKLLAGYVRASLESHWTGAPATPWLATGHSARAGTSCASAVAAGSGRGRAQEEPGDEVARGGKAAKARRGIEIPAPNSLDGPQTIRLPEMPGMRRRDSGVSPAPPASVHVFWDLEDKHPGSLDPRVLVHRVRGVAAAYGQVAGVYAYATRKVSNWVSDALFNIATGARQAEAEARARRNQQHLAARAARLDGEQEDEEGRQGEWGAGDSSPSSATVASRAGAGRVALQAAASQDSDPEQHRCEVCGAIRRSEADLVTHMRSVHGGGARPAGTGSSAPVNGPNRAVGRVLRYFNSAGAAFVPPSGHQLSLRYVLRCEGVDARIAQNAGEDSGVAMASGLMKLTTQMSTSAHELAGQQNATPSAGPARPIAIVMSDDVRLSRQMRQLRAAGFRIVLVSSDPGVVDKKRQLSSQAVAMVAAADVVLSWDAVRCGDYLVPPTGRISEAPNQITKTLHAEDDMLWDGMQY